jgi:hypothetical protein
MSRYVYSEDAFLRTHQGKSVRRFLIGNIQLFLANISLIIS